MAYGFIIGDIKLNIIGSAQIKRHLGSEKGTIQRLYKYSKYVYNSRWGYCIN